jgi:hypothetical protein
VSAASAIWSIGTLSLVSAALRIGASAGFTRA